MTLLCTEQMLRPFNRRYAGCGRTHWRPRTILRSIRPRSHPAPRPWGQFSRPATLPASRVASSSSSAPGRPSSAGFRVRHARHRFSHSSVAARAGQVVPTGRRVLRPNPSERPSGRAAAACPTIRTIPRREVGEERVESPEVPPFDRPLPPRRIVGTIGRGDDGTEVLKERAIEGEVEKETPAVRGDTQIGDPGSIVIGGAGGLGHPHLQGDVAPDVGSQCLIIATVMSTDRLFDDGAECLRVIAKPALDRLSRRAHLRGQS